MNLLGKHCGGSVFSPVLRSQALYSCVFAGSPAIYELSSRDYIHPYRSAGALA